MLFVLILWLWIARLFGELPNDLANPASELANLRYRSVTRPAHGVHWTVRRSASATQTKTLPEP